MHTISNNKRLVKIQLKLTLKKKLIGNQIKNRTFVTRMSRHFKCVVILLLLLFL